MWIIRDVLFDLRKGGRRLRRLETSGRQNRLWQGQLRAGDFRCEGVEGVWVEAHWVTGQHRQRGDVLLSSFLSYYGPERGVVAWSRSRWYMYGLSVWKGRA